MQQKLFSTVESTAKLDKDAANIQHGLNTRAYRAASKASGLQQKVMFGTTEEGPLQSAQRQLKQEIKQLSRALDGQVKEVMAPVTQKYSDDMIQLFKKRAGNLSQQLQNNRLYYNQDSNNTGSVKQHDPIMKQVELEESLADYKNKLQQALINVSTLQSKCEKQQEVVDNLNQLIKEVHEQNKIKTKRLEELEKKSTEQQEKIDKLQLLTQQQNTTIEQQANELKAIKNDEADIKEQLDKAQNEVQFVTDKMNAIHTKYKEKKLEIKQYQTLNFQLQQQIAQLSNKILTSPQFVCEKQEITQVPEPYSNINESQSNYQTSEQVQETLNAQTPLQIENTQVTNDLEQNLITNKLHLYKHASQVFYQTQGQNTTEQQQIQVDQEDNKNIYKDMAMQTHTETNEAIQQTSNVVDSTVYVDQLVGSSNDITDLDEVGVATDILQNESFGVQVASDQFVQDDNIQEQQHQNDIIIEQNDIELQNSNIHNDDQLPEQNIEETNEPEEQHDHEQQQKNEQLDVPSLPQEEMLSQ